MMFYKLLKKYRTREGLTLAQLSAKIGIDTSYLGRVERGESGIGFKHIGSLADVLNLTLEEEEELERQYAERKAKEEKWMPAEFTIGDHDEGDYNERDYQDRMFIDDFLKENFNIRIH